MAASHFYEVGSRLKAKLQSTDVIYATNCIIHQIEDKKAMDEPKNSLFI